MLKGFNGFNRTKNILSTITNFIQKPLEQSDLKNLFDTAQSNPGTVHRADRFGNLSAYTSLPEPEMAGIENFARSQAAKLASADRGRLFGVYNRHNGQTTICICPQSLEQRERIQNLFRQTNPIDDQRLGLSAVLENDVHMLYAREKTPTLTQ